MSRQLIRTGVPADRVQGIEREDLAGDGVPPLDRHRPFVVVLLITERLVDSRGVEDRRIEDRVGADRSLGRQLERVVGRLDQQNPGSAVAFQPPGGAARDQDVITVAE
jgi:hypothetical protein